MAMWYLFNVANSQDYAVKEYKDEGKTERDSEEGESCNDSVNGDFGLRWGSPKGS